MGTKPKDIQRLPPGTMDLFVEVGQVCREVDGFLEKRRAVTSPMLKVRLFAQGLEWTERLQALQGKVNARGAELDAELQQRMNAALGISSIGGGCRGASCRPAVGAIGRDLPRHELCGAVDRADPGAIGAIGVVLTACRREFSVLMTR